MNRRTLNRTASALNGVPSVNFTSSRSLNVYVVASLLTVHDFASFGTIFGTPVGLDRSSSTSVS